MTILEMFCSVDEFWQQFAPVWERELLAAGTRRRRRATQLHPSEIMTIVILFQQSHYRTFKAFYTGYVQVHLSAEFPGLSAIRASLNSYLGSWPRSPRADARESSGRASARASQGSR